MKRDIEHITVRLFMTDSQREHTMQLLATMVAEDRARLENKSFEEVFSQFRRSRTFEKLFDPECGLWENGPDYISGEYDRELAQTQRRIGCATGEMFYSGDFDEQNNEIAKLFGMEEQ